MIRNNVAREHSSRAMRLSTSIGVRRFARMEWSWKMRSNLSNDRHSARRADTNFEVHFGLRRELATGLPAPLEFSDERDPCTDPGDADVALDQRRIQRFRKRILRLVCPLRLLPDQ